VDAWLFERLATATSEVNDALTNYRFHEAAQVIYQFFWGDFCDWYIEWVKPDLQNQDRERAIVAWKNLFAAFDGALRLLHPFMPFLTEELWHQLPQRPGDKSIALMTFPQEEFKAPFQSRVNEFALLQDVITELRNIRAEMKLDSRKKVAAEFYSGYGHIRATVLRNLDPILRLATLTELTISVEPLPPADAAMRSTADFDLRIAYADVIDTAAELARVRKEIDRLNKDIDSKVQQLANKEFRRRAPEKIIRGMQTALEERQVELSKLLERLKQLEKSA
jgi:valyl-tRNA synthetase